ncbi:MAG: hypothetical protein QQN44_01800 [Nitrosopumilus sp.]
MTEDFVKIKEAKEALKGSFKGIIIKAGDLKSGTSNGKDWTKKTFTIEDESGTADLVAWGEEVSQFKIGYKYEIVNPWWKTYVDKQNVPHVTVQVGNYGTAKVIGSEPKEPLVEPDPTKPLTTTLPETPQSPPEQTVKQPEPEEPKIEKLTDVQLGTVVDATKILLAISLAVGEEVQKVAKEPSREFVMEATKIIYQTYFVSNFKKASDIK